ncbi:bifunctional hydroxymethylpyrimidine kinase/phosphomethylpyrimidine kinase [Paratractidigestivibacter sp.]|uniref:bifunctional hydroxymethylpyrimidine kinase/phosphomethylpyrimidine kinase n=1 Tax=Paratractidigestivibacter sp. TaxID=2847316 RepID=UPI002ABE6B03|nr:bifunctional hydroxymethylpyrimidine kinase/phosphomethylpyrimidine kinase [Paratractidigestivibacter sp.]
MGAGSVPCGRGRWSAEDIRRSMLVYAVTDRAWLHGRSLADCVREAIAGGATFVQLREKSAAHDEALTLARELKAVCGEAGVPFVIDDDVALAAEVGADGVHVGQSDMACVEARRILGDDAIVGVSAQTVEAALAAEAAGADYLGVGALHPTPTKPDAVDVTMDELRRICDAVSIPVVGIGGVDARTAHELAGTGVDGGAVVSAIFAADDCREAARELAGALGRAVGRRTRLRSVISIAGSDSSGGAGIQADIKTIEAMGLFAQTAVTALTAQNTTGVFAVAPTEPQMVSAQIDAVFDDITPDAVKIGMVPSGDVARAIAERLRAHGARNIVVDPVMVATSGAALSDDDAVGVEAAELFGAAAVVTPNIPETEALLGLLATRGDLPAKIVSEEDTASAASALAAHFGCAFLVKGGHGTHDANDVLATPGADGVVELRWFRSERIDNPNTHGTGCTLSSAIASGLALGLDVPGAVAAAKEYLCGCLRAGLDLGRGSGPLEHMWAFR